MITDGEEENRPQIALASDEDRAIDLSCRACGALALGAGLGFPVGVSAPLRFPPPTSDFWLKKFQSLGPFLPKKLSVCLRTEGFL